MQVSKRARNDGQEKGIIPYHPCHNGAHLSLEAKTALETTARSLATYGKGITACDESAGTIGTRFEAVGVTNTEENRRKYRQMLFEASGASEYLCGAILDPETLTQKSSSSGDYFPKVLESLKIVPGVKPHLKTYTLPGTKDTVMQGLDSLAARLNGYYRAGARFTKWRAPLEIDVAQGRPSRLAIEANMRDLARFALISQAEGMVPLVEPDVMLTGTHDLATAVAVNTEIAGVLYHAMLEHGVFMEGCILKVNMVNPGRGCESVYSVEDIAVANLEVLRRTLPAAIPGVSYLSGGQSLSDACARLSAINKRVRNDPAGRKYPWNLSFSWSAAIQMPLFALCKDRGLDAALPAMELLYLEELKMASLAAKGEWRWVGDAGAHRGAAIGSGDE
jgi:fructose-bisphosphate aldolase class I